MPMSTVSKVFSKVFPWHERIKADN